MSWCRGATAATELSYWDLNGNDLSTEDTNDDGVVDVNDCRKKNKERILSGSKRVEK